MRKLTEIQREKETEQNKDGRGWFFFFVELVLTAILAELMMHATLCSPPSQIPTHSAAHTTKCQLLPTLNQALSIFGQIPAPTLGP